jgi:hypothetical protein
MVNMMIKLSLVGKVARHQERRCREMAGGGGIECSIERDLGMPVAPHSGVAEGPKIVITTGKGE